jgi:hypothetical protein
MVHISTGAARYVLAAYPVLGVFFTNQPIGLLAMLKTGSVDLTRGI